MGFYRFHKLQQKILNHKLWIKDAHEFTTVRVTRTIVKVFTCTVVPLLSSDLRGLRIYKQQGSKNKLKPLEKFMFMLKRSWLNTDTGHIHSPPVPNSNQVELLLWTNWLSSSAFFSPHNQLCHSLQILHAFLLILVSFVLYQRLRCSVAILLWKSCILDSRLWSVFRNWPRVLAQ